MQRELPKMYQNKIDKNFSNVQKVYSTLYSSKEQIKDEKSDDRQVVSNKYSVEQKIYNIFKSPTFIYKADVTIETDDGLLNKRIIGKNRNNLITIDNEYIPIDKIRDIYTK